MQPGTWHTAEPGCSGSTSKQLPYSATVLVHILETSVRNSSASQAKDCQAGTATPRILAHTRLNKHKESVCVSYHTSLMVRIRGPQQRTFSGTGRQTGKRCRHSAAFSGECVNSSNDEFAN